MGSDTWLPRFQSYWLGDSRVDVAFLGLLILICEMEVGPSRNLDALVG